MSELSGYMYSLVSVPLYDTLGATAIEFIVNQTEMEVIIASADKAITLLDMISVLPTVKTIIVMGELDPQLVAQGAALNIQVHAWTNIERSGLEKPVSPNPPKADDVASICYTSGTTGTPK